MKENRVYRRPGVLVPIGIGNGSDEPISVIQHRCNLGIATIFSGDLKFFI